MHDLDLKTLRLLVAVCEHRNIKAAAAQEHIEPSAISKRIGQLEAALGTPLLVRGRRGVQPTPAGQALLEHARTLAFTLERIHADMAAFAGGLRGHVRLTASASVIAQQLPDDVAAFLRAPGHQGLQVDLEERLSRDVVRMVREGSASLGICWDDADLRGLQQQSYTGDRLALAMHPAHPLARRRRLRFDETLDEQHVVLPPGAAVTATMARAAARLGRPLQQRVVVSNFDAALRVVRAALAVSVIPLPVAQPLVAAGAIAAVPLVDAWAQRRFVVCHRDRAQLSAPALRLLDFLALRAAAG